MRYIAMLLLVGCMGAQPDNGSENGFGGKYHGYEGPCVKGDWNGDGKVTQVDYDMASRAYVSYQQSRLPKGSCNAYDMDNDGEFTDNDVSLIYGML